MLECHNIGAPDSFTVWDELHSIPGHFIPMSRSVHALAAVFPTFTDRFDPCLISVLGLALCKSMDANRLNGPP